MLASLRGPHGQGAKRTPDALGVARGTVHDQNHLKRQSPQARSSLTSDKASMDSIQEGALLVQPPDCPARPAAGACLPEARGQQHGGRGGPDHSPARSARSLSLRSCARCSLLLAPHEGPAGCVPPSDRPLSPACGPFQQLPFSSFPPGFRNLSAAPLSSEAASGVLTFFLSKPLSKNIQSSLARTKSSGFRSFISLLRRVAV